MLAALSIVMVWTLSAIPQFCSELEWDMLASMSAFKLFCLEDFGMHMRSLYVIDSDSEVWFIGLRSPAISCEGYIFDKLKGQVKFSLFSNVPCGYDLSKCCPVIHRNGGTIYDQGTTLSNYSNYKSVISKYSMDLVHENPTLWHHLATMNLEGHTCMDTHFYHAGETLTYTTIA